MNCVMLQSGELHSTGEQLQEAIVTSESASGIRHGSVLAFLVNKFCEGDHVVYVDGRQGLPIIS